MNQAAIKPGTERFAISAHGSLNAAVAAWFVTAAIGQWIFLSYVLAVYGGPLLDGNLALWNRHLSGAYVEGEWLGNLAAATHLALAVVILGGGPLQLIPAVRAKVPTLHRWTGRCYLLAVSVTAVVGLHMLFVRDIGALPTKIGFILQTGFVMAFGWLAYRRARERNFRAHRRWAIRLFLAASAVWFFRVILMIWVAVTGGVGVDFSTGKGPFLDFMAFGQYLPLLIAEVYFRVKDGGSSGAKAALAGFLFFAAAATALGVFLATIGMWFPAA